MFLLLLITTKSCITCYRFGKMSSPAEKNQLFAYPLNLIKHRQEQSRIFRNSSLKPDNQIVVTHHQWRQYDIIVTVERFVIAYDLCDTRSFASNVMPWAGRGRPVVF